MQVRPPLYDRRRINTQVCWRAYLQRIDLVARRMADRELNAFLRAHDNHCDECKTDIVQTTFVVFIDRLLRVHFQWLPSVITLLCSRKRWWNDRQELVVGVCEWTKRKDFEYLRNATLLLSNWNWISKTHEVIYALFILARAISHFSVEHRKLNSCSDIENENRSISQMDSDLSYW